MRRPKLYYGWYIVAAGAISAFLSSGLASAGLGALINPIRHDTGWSVTAISLGFSIRSFELGLLSPFTGYLADRLGPRRVAVAGMVVLGLGILLISQARDLWLYYLGAFVTATGQSLGGLNPFTMALVNWFDKKRGRAMGFLNAGNGSSYFAVTIIAGLLLVYDWRQILVIASCVIFLVGVPLSLVVRARPQEMGLRVDGDAPGDVPISKASLQQPAFGSGLQSGFTVREALRTPAFYLLAMAQTSVIAGVTAWSVHQVPHFENVGFSTSIAGVVVGIFAGIQFASRILTGWLGDVVGRRRLYVLSFFAMGLGMAFFARIDQDSAWLIPAYYGAWGLGMAAWVVLYQAILGDYFGTFRYATLRGLNSLFAVPAGAATPVVAGWMFDNTGSYATIFTILAGVVASGALWVLLVRRPLWTNQTKLQAAHETLNDGL